MSASYPPNSTTADPEEKGRQGKRKDTVKWIMAKTFDWNVYMRSLGRAEVEKEGQTTNQTSFRSSGIVPRVHPKDPLSDNFHFPSVSCVIGTFHAEGAD